MPKVFVPNRAGHDYADAARYGELISVTTGLQPKYSTNLMYRQWVELLKDSESTDYILITGLPIITNIGCAIFAVMHKRLNLLIWRSGKYISRTIVLDL